MYNNACGGYNPWAQIYELYVAWCLPCKDCVANLGAVVVASFAVFFWFSLTWGEVSWVSLSFGVELLTCYVLSEWKKHFRFAWSRRYMLQCRLLSPTLFCKYVVRIVGASLIAGACRFCDSCATVAACSRSSFSCRMARVVCICGDAAAICDYRRTKLWHIVCYSGAMHYTLLYLVVFFSYWLSSSLVF